jgi:hypothetical protein
MADKRISQLIERVNIANNDVLPIVASGATTTNKVTISTIQTWMQDNLDVGVTSVGITIGSTGTDINVTGSPVTSSGNITINIPTASATNRGLLSSSDWTSFNNKLSSVGLTMPSAFTVSNSPLTANGTIAVTGAGTVAQYIRGDGSLADFPEAGGGGSSVSYYLNGSVSQGTIGGIAYYEMNKTPVLGAGTDFVAIADGYLASFITDAGDPSLLEIPAGNWNFETYFSASSGGGTPTFYIELYKVNSGGTATLIASNSGTPELIAFGTTITPYFSTLAVPTTALAITDRLALRYYVARSGRTITLHTENSHLCQIITTFTTGLTALNGLTAQVQNFATGTSGTDFGISSSTATHTFNLPDASASARGVVTTGTQTFAGIKTFNSTITAGAEVQLVQAGTALPTFIKNISGSGLTSSGSNGIGFNNSNNLYLSGSDKGGAVFSINNTGVRTYTFQDNNGTLAFTSDLGAYLPLAGGTLTGALGGTSATFSGDVQSNTRLAATSGTHSIIITPNVGSTNRIEAIGSLPLALVSAHPSITMAAGGTTPQFTLGSSGLVTLTGALNGTSASFIVNQNSTVTNSFQNTNTTDTNSRNILDVTAGNSTLRFLSINNDHVYISPTTSRNTYLGFGNALTLASTGAATFSSTLRATEITASMPSGNGALYINNSSLTSKNWTFIPSTNAGETDLLLFYTGAGAGTKLTLASTGAATFSSSVTARNGVFKNPGSDPNNTLFVQTSDYVFASAGSLLRLGHVATTGNTTATIQNLTLGGTGTGNISFPDGNVGIGTASPSSKLSVDGDIRLQSSTATAKSIVFSSPASNWGPQDSSIKFTPADGTNAATSLSFNLWDGLTNTIERMRITSAGNVGIGTDTPFQVASGRVTTSINGPAAGSAILNLGVGGVLKTFLYSDSANTILEGSGTAITINASGSNFIALQTADVDRIRITSTGNVGIGTATPTKRLNVEASVAGEVTNIKNTRNNASGDYALVTELGSNCNNTNNYHYIAGTGGADKFYIYGNGNVVNINNSYGSLSDIKLKENIEDASPKLDDLMKVKVRNYNLIGDDKKQIGVIAQELEEVFPAMIDESEDFEEVEVPQLDEEGNEVLNEEGEVVTENKRVSKGTTTKSVKYSVFVPMLIKAMQEQQEQIKSLTKQVEALKSQING